MSNQIEEAKSQHSKLSNKNGNEEIKNHISETEGYEKKK